MTDLAKYSAVFIFILFACKQEKNGHANRSGFYYTSYRNGTHPIDTVFVKSPDRSVIALQNIFTAEFDGIRPVYKFIGNALDSNKNILYYYTEDFGVFYNKDIVHKSYRRLHSTDDSTERAISRYFDFMLTNQNLLVAGEDYIQLGDSIINLVLPCDSE